MCKFNPKNDSRRIDPCIKGLIRYLNIQGIKTIASCCGHGKYPLTIVVRATDTGEGYEIVSGKYIVKRKKYFYKKDKKGYYYIPEVNEKK